MKKILSILMVILLVSTLTIPVLSANDDTEKSPSFFLIWPNYLKVFCPFRSLFL